MVQPRKLVFLAGAVACVVAFGPWFGFLYSWIATVVSAGGTSYYGCGGAWYNQAYVNGSVTYVTVTPPPGY